MFFDSFAEFINMGGHGMFVWLSYGVAGLVVAHNFISPLLTRKKVIKDIERQMRREQK
ncbi:heme exporter protein CcmD [Bermanella sp. WJH001]|uniref:heme exporter protein CcmD n=1 Tax=Bermanella sp. WJH001 TaxID=3048005 RepID=UPI0024BE0A1E|nr:heme exporter protein CcmD [Bermanella sp. WJH001]MDJ1536743.1 heme exporter protein CcmD [Bermanella sp. WJH001]